MTFTGRLVAGIAFALIAVGSVPAPAAADGWSAIAVDFRDDMTKTAYGIGRGAGMPEAGSAAAAFCVKAGGKNCHVVVSYTNCGAFAASAKSIGYGMAPDKKTAESNALAGCGGSICQVVVSDCN